MTFPVAIALPSLNLSDDQKLLVGGLRMRLHNLLQKHKVKSDLYEAKRTAKDLGISAPEGLPELVNAVMGWPGTVVDVLEERLEKRGWVGADELNLGDIYRDNHLEVEAGRVHLDALIYGCGFITVGKGDTTIGEPDVLVSVESTESCTVEWDYRLRRAKSALSQTRNEFGVTVMETLYLPNETIVFEHVRGELVVTDRDPHGLGRVPVAMMVNRERASDVKGRSEITRAITYYTDAAVRTLLGMEINREFYTSPKWTALNADPAVFGLDENASEAANKRAGWKATSGMMNVVPPQEDVDGNAVEVKLHEFRPAPPTPYIDQLKSYSQLVAAESGMPASYLGFGSVENSPSADSIRQQEYRLVKRAERRQMSFGLAWLEVARLALMIRDGSVDPDVFRNVSVSWRDASTPTRAAAADEAAKLIGAGVLPADSSVTLDRIGLSPQEQLQLAADRRRATGGTILERLRTQQATPVNGNDNGTAQPNSQPV